MRNILAWLTVAVLATAFVDRSVAQAQVAVDNSYFDWQGLPYVARFGERYNPYYFARESGGTREVLAMDRSLYWNRGGTQLREIKAIVVGDSLYLYASTQTNLAPEVSLFFYVYLDRGSGEPNRYTLELLPSRRKNGGFVALWSRDAAQPVEVGELANASFTMEARIDLAKLPAALREAWKRLSVDVTTCYYEAASGTYEEFYFTTLSSSDLLGGA